MGHICKSVSRPLTCHCSETEYGFLPKVELCSTSSHSEALTDSTGGLNNHYHYSSQSLKLITFVVYNAEISPTAPSELFWI